jgi:hypothetical protein
VEIIETHYLVFARAQLFPLRIPGGRTPNSPGTTLCSFNEHRVLCHSTLFLAWQCRLVPLSRQI